MKPIIIVIIFRHVFSPVLCFYHPAQLLASSTSLLSLLPSTSFSSLAIQWLLQTWLDSTLLLCVPLLALALPAPFGATEPPSLMGVELLLELQFAVEVQP